MKNQEEKPIKLILEEEVAFVPYVLTKEQKGTDPNGVWENFFDGIINAIKTGIEGGDEDGTLRKKIREEMNEKLSDVQSGFTSVDEVLLIGLGAFNRECGGSWAKNQEKWKKTYESLLKKKEEKESSMREKEKNARISEIKEGLAGEDWDTVGEYIETKLKEILGNDHDEYDDLRKEMYEHFEKLEVEKYKN